MDIDPVYAEITIRRLERYRRTGKTGWQNSHPFAEELDPKMSTERSYTTVKT
jgi:site-specific DNA-methyltransferase (adenine-specific)